MAREPGNPFVLCWGEGMGENPCNKTKGLNSGPGSSPAPAVFSLLKVGLRPFSLEKPALRLSKRMRLSAVYVTTASTDGPTSLLPSGRHCRYTVHIMDKEVTKSLLADRSQRSHHG